jgi:hypothetical protein
VDYSSESVALYPDKCTKYPQRVLHRSNEGISIHKYRQSALHRAYEGQIMMKAAQLFMSANVNKSNIRNDY